MSDRRNFLKAATTLAAGAIALGAKSSDLSINKNVLDKPKRLPQISKHLPDKLTISMWHWGWVIGSNVGEPYENLEKTCAGLSERGFNTIRIDAMLNCCFTNDGKLRDEVPFKQFIPGYSNRLRDMNYRGGIRRNVLDKIIELLQFAKKYNFYVIISEWEYMHTYWFYEDKSIAEGLFAIPLEKRMMDIAEKHDKLITILKEKDLVKNIAYIDILNEPPYSDVVKGDGLKTAISESIDFLKKKHSDIMITVSDPQTWASDNMEVYDIHPYVGSGLYWSELWGKTITDKDFDKNNPKKNDLMKMLLEDSLINYDDFMSKAPAHVPDFWLKLCWFFSNVDCIMYDRHMMDLYKTSQQNLKEYAEKEFSRIATEGASRKLPVCVTETGFFSSPLNSRFEESEYGLAYFDHLTDCAIKNNFWGLMQDTYNGPGCPLWWTNPKWLYENNQRFINSKIL
jgi:hypothetical protein